MPAQNKEIDRSLQTCSGSAKTHSASRYLQQLCKHWSHKADADFDASQGTIAFPNGNKVTLVAWPDHLDVEAAVGPEGDIQRWKTVIAEHLVRFAFREDFALKWDE